MRHQKKGFKLNRTASHRKATMSALSNSLIRHKRITTTWTKARALRMYIEPIINRSKDDSTHSRRQVFRYLQDKESVTELFGDIATHVAERPGGYTRIVKLGQRAGDSAEMAMIELVDYNDVRPDGTGDSKKRKTRRAGRKRGRSADETAATAVAVDATTEAVTEAVTVQPDDEPEAEVVDEVLAEDVAAVAEPEPEPTPEPEAEVKEAAPEPEAEVKEAAPEPEAEPKTQTDESSEEESGTEASDPDSSEGEKK